MRAILLIAFLLAAAACNKPTPANATPAPTEPNGFFGNVNGHRILYVQQGEYMIAVPFDDAPAGTVIVKDKKAYLLESRNSPRSPDLESMAFPGAFPGFAPVCPCCQPSCGGKCAPIAPCEPFAFPRWPVLDFETRPRNP